MTAVRVVTFIGGLLVAGWGLLAAVRTVVLPRGDVNLLTRAVFFTTGKLFRLLASERREYLARDRVMALYAPVSLVLLPFAWAFTVAIGFTLMFWALGGRTWFEAFSLSGSSLLTLGFVRAESFADHVLAFAEATAGLGIVALLISYLPTMYNAFSRREREVALLEVRAGSPPSAVELLLRFHSIGWADSYQALWDDWERWFAEVDETHTSYPPLVFFRSPQPDRSWVTAGGVVLDTAALVNAAIDLPHDPSADICLRAGYIALRHVAAFFGIVFDPDPAPDDPVSITRTEFDEALDSLAAGGVPLGADRDAAWAAFAGWRVNYDTVLLSLAELTMAPYAPWTSDRSAPGQRRTVFRRWGPRGRPAVEPSID
jgi:hypothetical protein